MTTTTPTPHPDRAEQQLTDHEVPMPEPLVTLRPGDVVIFRVPSGHSLAELAAMRALVRAELGDDARFLLVADDVTVSVVRGES